MELQPGAKAEKESRPPLVPDWVIRTGGLVGFLLLSLAAVGILGAVVLLPEYTRLKNDEYRRDCEAATVKDLQSLIKVHGRFFADVPQDPVELSRLAMSICSYVPTSETVIPIRSRLPSTPGMVKINPAPRPPKPDDVLIRYSARVENPATRRGLCLIAGGLMLAAMFLYSTPGRRKKLLAQPS
jgi:hypothetical protein